MAIGSQLLSVPLLLFLEPRLTRPGRDHLTLALELVYPAVRKAVRQLQNLSDVEPAEESGRRHGPEELFEVCGLDDVMDQAAGGASYAEGASMEGMVLLLRCCSARAYYHLLGYCEACITISLGIRF